MIPTMLILLPPLALLTWRGDWPSAAALLGSVLLVAYLDWSAHKTDWNGSVAVDLKALRSQVEGNDKEAREAMVLATQNLVKLAAEVKRLGEVAEGHSRALQQTGKPRSIL